MDKIFISYRRDDSADIAGRIYDHLILPLGIFSPEDVFKDVDSIPLGVNFKDYLENKVKQCTVGLIIIGPNWLTIKDSIGRRLDDPQDYVRVEIEIMLERGISVIPLFVMGAEMPTETELPVSLRRLTLHNGTSIRRDPDFRRDLSRVRSYLEQYLNQNLSTPSPESNIGQLPLAPLVSQAFTWIEIPNGEVTLESGGYVPDEGKTTKVKTFAITKYPITCTQFSEFVDAEGYLQHKWWTDKGWQYLVKQDKASPSYWKNDRWYQPTKPVIGITWYEAIAFCRWLSNLLGEKITLPTEQQWQLAAQGEDNRKYPWGELFDKNRCNVRESGLAITTPIDQYEGKGDSPFGIVDMTGNVSEWTLTDYDHGVNQISGEGNQVVRGGSWKISGSLGRVAKRDWFLSSIDSTSIGFRCVRAKKFN